MVDRLRCIQHHHRGRLDLHAYLHHWASAVACLAQGCGLHSFRVTDMVSNTNRYSISCTVF
jgi:hypothetical protein